MKSVYKPCQECYDYPEKYSDCCDYEVEGNKCGLCGKFCSTHECYMCDGHGGENIVVGQHGTMVMDISNNKLTKSQITLIKRLGDKSDFYPDYYHLNVVVKDIIDSHNIVVTIGEYGKKEFTISIDEFYE